MATDFAGDSHHLCAYDRAGVGGATTRTEPRRTTDDQVIELLALLDAVDLQEPLVVVAHSLGSLPALGLVDALRSGLPVWCSSTPGGRASAAPPEPPCHRRPPTSQRTWPGNATSSPSPCSTRSRTQSTSLLATCDEIAIKLLDEPGPVFGDLPVIVLQAPLPERPHGLPRDYDAVARASWVDANVEFAAESTRGQVVEVEDTGHDIHVDQPEAVMDAIRDVLAG